MFTPQGETSSRFYQNSLMRCKSRPPDCLFVLIVECLAVVQGERKKGAGGSKRHAVLIAAEILIRRSLTGRLQKPRQVLLQRCRRRMSRNHERYERKRQGSRPLRSPPRFNFPRGARADPWLNRRPSERRVRSTRIRRAVWFPAGSSGRIRRQGARSAQRGPSGFVGYRLPVC